MKTSKFHKCFVVFRLTSFSRNLRTELKKAQKIYFAERLKFSHYNRRPANMYFWRTRTQKEIDYVEEYDGQIAGYEFKWGATKPIKVPKDFLAAYTGSTVERIDRSNYWRFLLPPIT